MKESLDFVSSCYIRATGKKKEKNVSTYKNSGNSTYELPLKFFSGSLCSPQSLVSEQGTERETKIGRWDLVISPFVLTVTSHFWHS